MEIDIVDGSKLLDTFTQLLAYMGDPNALDGYAMKPRKRRLTPEMICTIVKAILDYLEHDIPMSYVPDDIVTRVLTLKELSADNKYSSQYAELIEYIRDYE
jgi:hypothetical protein